MTCKYEIAGTTNAKFSVYALLLHEQEVELIQSSGNYCLEHNYRTSQ